MLPQGRGRTFKSGKKAPEALIEALQPVRNSIKPTAVVAKEMFGGPAKPAAARKPAAAAPKPAAAAPKPVAAKFMSTVSKPVTAAPKPVTAAPKALTAVPVPKPVAPAPEAPAPEAPAVEEGAELADMLESQEAPPVMTSELDRLTPEQKEMAVLITQEETRDLYDTQVPTAYVPQTRRGFAEFIKLQYKPYILPSTPIEIPEGDKYYPYQKFVRDYMRKEAPYRGILVYHGLGSGKTCTAIAAAEALFATAKKNIIVMSPKSLKKNFLREVSKCGFRHFQLTNFWVALTPHPRDDPTTMFFANSVLGLSSRYLKKARNVWVPDFRKPQSEANYASLDPDDRAEIRKQILSIVEYDPDTNPTGRIKFISYNGISAKKLMAMACDTNYKKFFDDSVIVVDEIHNLIRTIHGNIQAYLVKPEPGQTRAVRKLEVETITPDRWVPNPIMCDPGRSKDFYRRGYLFYRLLLDAKNSKIVGLSGTPLINYPEELGILSNVLHGYITIVEGVIQQTGKAIQTNAKDIGLKHPFVDYAGTKNDTVGTRVVLSLLPSGNIKISNDIGVMRIPPFTETELYVSMYAVISDLFVGEKKPAVEEIIGAVRGVYEESSFPPFELIQGAFRNLYAKNPEPTRKELSDAIVRVYTLAQETPQIVESIKAAYKEAGLELRDVVVRSEALLPPFGEDFQRDFVPNGIDLINKAALLTRLTGLVSYYKGSSLELMPRVKSDEVVRVAFSDYAQKAYSFKRGIELKKEMESKSGTTVDAAMAQVYELGDSTSSNNYKMGSRQACNFAFPPEVTRPTTKNKLEEKEEAAAGVAAVELVTLAPDAEKETAKELEEEFPELSEEKEDELVLDEEVVVGAEAEEADQEGAADQEGGAKTLAELRAEKANPGGAEAKAAADCKGGRKPGEPYPDACKRAKLCLATVAKKRMTLGGEDGLQNYSAKFAAMLERIAAAPGSSLIYSQFLDMEGIGIFRIAMDVNGYAPIEIVETGGTISFTKAAEASLRLGPGKQPRYMTFSGGETEKVRGAALSIFNAQFSDLPESMNTILKESGYTDNKVGELCRVFCITSAGAEGLSLRNVRAVHIMEPYWNEVRLRQVKGRAIRIGSHLDLPVDQRDVSIYTYVSVFSDDAQSNKVPDRRIDQTILLHDSVDAKKAVDMGLTVKPGMTTYVLTTDEIIYAISERKRKVIEALECILKSASVDCEVNLKKNKDGSFMCLPLKGKVGDFIYNPVLRDDLLEAPQFQDKDGKDILDKVCVTSSSTQAAQAAEAKAEAKAADPAANDIFKALKGVTYRMRPVMNEAGVIERFDMYEADQKKPMTKIPEKLLGTAGVQAGKPAPPVKMF